MRFSNILLSDEEEKSEWRAEEIHELRRTCLKNLFLEKSVNIYSYWNRKQKVKVND